MDTRVLNLLVEEQQKAIANEPNTRKMAQRALELGDVCMAAGCPMMAIEVWKSAAKRLEAMDYYWVDVPLYFEAYTSFDHLVSEKDGITLGRRIDKAWLLLGHREMATWARHMRKEYSEMWLDRYYEALP
jgi:hypothetical protein